jgi:hypothetical protein
MKNVNRKNNSEGFSLKAIAIYTALAASAVWLSGCFDPSGKRSDDIKDYKIRSMDSQYDYNVRAGRSPYSGMYIRLF